MEEEIGLEFLFHLRVSAILVCSPNHLRGRMVGLMQGVARWKISDVPSSNQLRRPPYHFG